MISLEEALCLIKSQVKEITETEYCSLWEAVGRIAAEDVAAQADHPSFPRSPLDGYGVSAADIEKASVEQPVSLEVTEEILAGAVSNERLQSGHAVRIMTGAPLPEGVDTVVRQEDTDFGEQTVNIYQPVNKYQNYCFQGEDFHQGDILIKRGDKLDAIRIATAAAMGYDRLLVMRCPRVAVLTTGSELLEPGDVLEPGKIYDSNRFLVYARLREWGISPVWEETLPDEPEIMADYIKRISRESDLIVTTGGVSVGKKDILHEVLGLLGARRLFWKIRIKPGSPMMAAVYQDTCILSLSGNPFGVAVGVEVLVRPALYFLTGNKDHMSTRRKVVLEQAFPKESAVMRLVRGWFNNGKVSVSEGSHASGVLSTMIGCNCLIEIPPGPRKQNEEEKVWVTLL